MPQQEVQPVDNLSPSSAGGSLISLDTIPSADSMSSRSSNNSSEMSFRQYIDLPPQEPLPMISREPFLDEVLREMAGSRDLRTLEEVKLILASSMVCIQDLNVFLPSLVSLNLEGSTLNSLRDLGIHLKIKHLNVSRCGLRSLDGTNGLSTIVDLVADGNSIRTVNPLCNLSNLHKLSIRNNFILNVDTVSFMALCQKLSHLDLTGNPVCAMPDYREAVKSVVPTLQILDDCVLLDPIPDQVPSLSSSEYSSSSASTEPKLSPSEEYLELTKSYKPNKIRPVYSVRLSSYDAQLDQGTPISGNIVTAARRKKSAWASGSSTSSSDMDSLSSFSMDNRGAAAVAPSTLHEPNMDDLLRDDLAVLDLDAHELDEDSDTTSLSYESLPNPDELETTRCIDEFQ